MLHLILRLLVFLLLPPLPLSLSAPAPPPAPRVADVVIVGSGLAGLSCGALLSAAGYKVEVHEAHYELGGCCHSFLVDRKGRAVPSSSPLARSSKPSDFFHFEAGPSLYTGISPSRTPNPLAHVYQMIGREPDWLTYTTWGADLPNNVSYAVPLGQQYFEDTLLEHGGRLALDDWRSLSAQLRPLTRGVMELPSAAVRPDAGVLRTLALKYPAALASTLLAAPKILAPFDVAAYGVTSPFLINYMNMIAFLLQGLPADRTLTAVMAYMVDDFYRPGAVLDFPKGGSSALVKPLVAAIAAAGGSVHASSPVAAITVGKGGEASGVRLESGREVRASKAVVYVRGGAGRGASESEARRAVRGRAPPPRCPARKRRPPA